MPFLRPPDDEPSERDFLGKLVHGSLFFLGTFALTGVLFAGLWLWLGQEDEDSAARKPGMMNPQATRTATRPAAAQLPARGNADEASMAQGAQGAHMAKGSESTDDAIDGSRAALTASGPKLALDPSKRQGPKAGALVAPPARDVTPGGTLSPLHQRQALTRVEGNPLPPPPKREPLPQIFRKVVVEAPTELELTIGTSRIIPVRLAHIEPPSSDQQCWFAGQQASCTALATTALRRYIRRRAIGCDWLEDSVGQESALGAEALVDETGRQTARCYLGRGLAERRPGQEPKNVTDLSSWLVRFGWAEPEDGFYADERMEASSQNRGIHATRDSTGGQEAEARQQEMQALSRTLDAEASSIAPSKAPSMPMGTEGDGLSLMQEPDVTEEQEWALPPGFELR